MIYDLSLLNFHLEPTKWCKRNLEITPSLIILNGNYSEVQRRDSKCISYKGAWHFNWPFRKETKQFPLPKHFHLSPSKQQPQPSRTSLTRLISTPHQVRGPGEERVPPPQCVPQKKSDILMAPYLGHWPFCRDARLQERENGIRRWWLLGGKPSHPIDYRRSFMPFLREILRGQTQNYPLVQAGWDPEGLLSSTPS